jgi:hypothetical protein
MLKQILGLLGLVMGGKEIDRLAMASAGMTHGSTFYDYRKPNQRRQRENMRRTVFASRKIARGF